VTSADILSNTSAMEPAQSPLHSHMHAFIITTDTESEGTRRAGTQGEYAQAASRGMNRLSDLHIIANKISDDSLIP
jgi:prephenate dehydratase